jgi:hypothetical protein
VLPQSLGNEQAGAGRRRGAPRVLRPCCACCGRAVRAAAVLGALRACCAAPARPRTCALRCRLLRLSTHARSASLQAKRAARGSAVALAVV